MADSKQPKYRNNEKVKIHLQNTIGGPTFVDNKIGIANTFYSSTAMDHHTMPSQISVLPGMSDVSGGVVTDLITAMDQDLNGVRYGAGDQGGIYRISTSNVVSKIATLNTAGSAGMYYHSISDQLYIPDQDSVSLYGQVTNPGPGPQFRPSQFGPQASGDPGCCYLYNPSSTFFDTVQRNNAVEINQAVGITDTNQVTTVTATGTFNVPAALSEADPDQCGFVPDIEPGFSIAVNVTTIGTGNWTLTLHDSLNNSLVAVTIPNGEMVVGYNNFIFGSQIRVIVATSQTGGSAAYHWHLTSTVNDGFIAVVPANPAGVQFGTGDMRSADFLWFAYALVETNNGWHPTTSFALSAIGAGAALNLVIGNGKYLATYDFSNDSGPTTNQFVRHALVFKNGYEVCGLSTNNQYLIAALERRSNDPTRNYQDGQLVFWDGTTPYANFIIDIPMGAPYGLQTFNNVTYFIVAGSLFAWSGGQTVIKVRRLAYQNTDYLGVVDSTIVNPNMMAIRYNLLEIGYPSSTTNINLNYGVYSWGSVELAFPNSMGYSYQLSNGLQNYSPSNNLAIGCVYNFVDQMYTPWSYTDSGGINHFGLDYLSNSSGPAPSGNFRSLIYDSGLDYKQKMGLREQLTFLPLPSGYTLQAFYSRDRGSDVLSPPANVGDTKLVLEVDNARGREFQWGYYWTQTGAVKPLIVTGVTMELASLPEENDITAYAE